MKSLRLSVYLLLSFALPVVVACTGDTDTDAVITEIAVPPSGGSIKVAHCAIEPGGDIYVAWQQDDGGQDIWLARSQDNGESFEAPVGVETGTAEPMGGWGPSRRPYVAADGNRLAVTYGTSDSLSMVVLSTSLSPITFAQPVEVGSNQTTDVEEFPKGVFAPDGNLWVLWHRTVNGAGIEEVLVSREEDGWAYEEISGGDTPGKPCDCCPPDIRFNDAGVGLVTYRNNVSDIREQFVARDESHVTGGSAGFTTATAASSTAWTMFVCPVDGPRLSESSSGTQLLTWADASSGDSRVWVSQSTDDGETWLGDQMVADDSGGAQNRPTIAQGADGTVWLTMDKLGTSDVLLSSTDGGSTFDSGRAISTPGGDLEIPELCSGGALTGLVGIAGDGALYWVGL